MPVCKVIRGQKREICIGDLDREVTLKSRTLTEPGVTDPANQYYYTETMATINTPTTSWAMRKSVNGKTVFDRTNIERVVTDEFYLRFDATITAEYWLLDGLNTFDILTVENLDGRSDWMRLNCNDRGLTASFNNNM